MKDARILDKVILVDYDEVQALINEHLNPDYDLVADELLHNYSYKLCEDIGLPKSYDFSKHKTQDLIRDYENGTIDYEYEGVNSYLELLVHIGLIEPGHYLIAVYW